MTTGSIWHLYRSGVGAKAAGTPPFAPHRLTITESAGAWREAVMLRLQELIRLEPGWDGYYGQPVSLENATFALRMLEATCGDNSITPQIVPGPNGDLQIEWHTDHGDVEILVRGPNSVRAWRHLVGFDPDGEEVELTNDFLMVAQWILEVTEPQIAVRAAA